MCNTVLKVKLLLNLKIVTLKNLVRKSLSRVYSRNCTNARKYMENSEIIYNFWREYSYACDYCMHGGPKTCPAQSPFKKSYP